MIIKGLCCSEKYLRSGDFELISEFADEEGYKIALAIPRDLNDYAEQLRAINYVIKVLTDWKNEDFYTNQTAYKINWFGCYKCDTSIGELTLSQAKKLFAETKIKYDTLFDLLLDVAETHYKDNVEEFFKKYFVDVEV